MNKKIMATFAVLIFALSAAGLVYAHWSDMVYIEATVEMGSLTFGFGEIVREWDWEYYADEKEVAEGVCTLSEPETDVHTGKTVYKLLTFTITAAYPQYWAINKYTLDNAGTIPVKIQSVTIKLPAGFTAVESATYPGVMWEIYDDRTPAKLVYNIWLYKQGPGWPANDPPWELVAAGFTLPPFKGNQLEPCTPEYAEICVDPKQDAEECHTYTFSIEIEAIQWNKYTP